jgi:hypothetical protein
MSEPSSPVSFPEGVSLQRVANVLLEAWEVGSHQWNDGPLQLHEESGPSPLRPVPGDALDLFRVLAERKIPYLLVGGLAMLTYVQGRNTQDVDLLMSVSAMQQIPDLVLEDQNEFFAKGRFRSVRVDLLLTQNPLFLEVQRRFAANHRFAEMEVPCASVEGLIVLKLYALPSLYRQMNMDRVALYENDVTMLLARHHPPLEGLLSLVERHVEPGDVKELRSIAAECAGRAARLRQRTGS